MAERINPGTTGSSSTERVTSSAREQASRVTDTASGAAQDVAQQAREKAQQAKGTLGARARDQVDQRSTMLGEKIESTASDLRSVGETLRERDQEGPAGLADQVAQRLSDVGSYMQRSSSDDLLRDAENLARRQPWLIAAGSLALGFVASRFLKASSERRSGGDGGWQATGEPDYLRASNEPVVGTTEPVAGATEPVGVPEEPVVGGTGRVEIHDETVSGRRDPLEPR